MAIKKHMTCSRSQICFRSVLATVLAAILGTAAAADAAAPGDNQSVEIILDASASMWNRLGDGRYRIAAAKEVLKQFVGTLPDEAGLNVGLRIFGSRVHFSKEGACQDSYLSVPVRGLEKKALLNEVDTAKAIGATPLATSLLEASRDLPAQGKKLVVVFTDGEESCGQSLEDAVRELQKAHVNVTLKIVGIGLSREAVDRFKKVADIENVDSGAALASALTKATESAVKTASMPVTVTINVTRAGAPLKEAAVSLLVPNGAVIPFNASNDAYKGTVKPGVYEAIVKKNGQEASFHDIAVSGDAKNIIELDFPLSNVTLEAPKEKVIAGQKAVIRFAGAPNVKNQWIGLYDVGKDDELERVEVKGEQGEAMLATPEEPLQLDARFLVPSSAGMRVAGKSAAFQTEGVKASLSAPDEAPAGSSISVTWEGPNAEHDYTAIAKPQSPDTEYLEYAYTARGKTVLLHLPITEGEYELRYIGGHSSKALAKRTVRAIPVTATLNAAEEAKAGSIVNIDWQGPNYEGDYVTITRPDEPEHASGSYAYTRQGTPAKVTVPDSPTIYELRYVTGREHKVLARRTVKVVATGASVTPPREVGAGARFEVHWTGPKNNGDYISLASPGDKDSQYHAYAYAKGEKPVSLRAPDKEGNYEIRYVTGQEHKLLAQSSIRVLPVTAAVSAPEQVVAGATFQISWSGPRNEGDFISIAQPGSRGSLYIHYAYAKGDKPVSLRAPDQDGEYEVRYVTGQDQEILARTTIRITAAQASVSAPPQAIAGSPLAVAWAGPKNEGDYISIANPKSKGSDYHAYEYVGHSEGTVTVRLPDEAGAYEVRYVTGQDERILARTPVEVKGAHASLSSPDAGVAEQMLDVTWDGPNNDGDHIAIAHKESDAGDSVTYIYTKGAKSPAKIQLPEEPGQYELRYVTGQKNLILARTKIEVRGK